jgi:hypothetical protein
MLNKYIALVCSKERERRPFAVKSWRIILFYWLEEVSWRKWASMLLLAPMPKILVWEPVSQCAGTGYQSQKSFGHRYFTTLWKALELLLAARFLSFGYTRQPRKLPQRLPMTGNICVQAWKYDAILISQICNCIFCYSLHCYSVSVTENKEYSLFQIWKKPTCTAILFQ